MFLLFFLNDTAPTEIYTLSLHDALPIFRGPSVDGRLGTVFEQFGIEVLFDKCNKLGFGRRRLGPGDRKSTRLNSSHVAISYAVFCLKKKKKKTSNQNV